MKFEEVLPEFREGKKIRCSDWDEGKYIYLYDKKILTNNGIELVISGGSLTSNDWEIYEKPKKKVKYYAALIKEGEKTLYNVSYRRFKNEEEAKEYFSDFEFIRLITEIPELTDEREE